MNEADNPFFDYLLVPKKGRITIYPSSQLTFSRRTQGFIIGRPISLAHEPSTFPGGKRINQLIAFCSNSSIQTINQPWKIKKTNQPQQTTTGLGRKLNNRWKAAAKQGKRRGKKWCRPRLVQKSMTWAKVDPTPPVADCAMTKMSRNVKPVVRIAIKIRVLEQAVPIDNQGDAFNERNAPCFSFS